MEQVYDKIEVITGTPKMGHGLSINIQLGSTKPRMRTGQPMSRSLDDKTIYKSGKNSVSKHLSRPRAQPQGQASQIQPRQGSRLGRKQGPGMQALVVGVVAMEEAGYVGTGWFYGPPHMLILISGPICI